MELKNKLTKAAYHILMPLFLGALIYVFLRSDNSFISNLSGRKFAFEIYPLLDTYIKYSLADGLWLYAFLWALHLINVNQKRIGQILTLAATAMAIVVEIGQHFNIVSGTFDFLDILTYMFAFLIFQIILSDPLKHSNPTHEKQHTSLP